MFGTEHFPVFVLSGILLNLSPGQDTLYIVGRSVSQGRRAGVLSVLGIVSGTIVHTSAAAFGLSAILATSAQAFTVVRLAGAAYLVWLGLAMIFRTVGSETVALQSAPANDFAIYRAGLLTNVLNPKVALFFLAFLPQFVSPSAPSRVLAFVFLGGMFVVTGTVWCLVLVWGASAMSRRLRERGAGGALLKRATGAVFVGLGVRLAVNR
jgi:threonine/homoserine/homoserine lactone efflux protein